MGRTAQHLILFARHPRLGRGKSRLAREIGQRATLAFYRATLAASLRALGRDRRWRTWIAATPDRTKSRWPGAGAGCPSGGVLGQGRGDLGARMGRALARFARARAIIIGSDIPGIAAADIAAAFAALGRADAVFGPAPDGGYWLVGVGPLRRPARLFAAVRWSSAQALADTMANCTRAGARVALAAAKRDVDCAADLAALGRAKAPR